MITQRRFFSSRLSSSSLLLPLRKKRLLSSAIFIGFGACFSHHAEAQTVEPGVVPLVPVKKIEKPEKLPAPIPAVAAETGAEVTSMATVTMQAERPTNRIDRQVYDVKSDVSSTNGSAVDALANVPSVAVDPDGTVSLRGSTNVQILIDGKPSAMLQGDNRGAALNAIPAADIDSVEVINNPGAQFGNEGGGPILNLVMRRNRRPGGFGLVNANLGSDGRYNTALSGSYNQGLFGFQGGVNYRHDGRNSIGDATRERIDPVSGLTTHSTQKSSATGLNDAIGVNSILNYNLTDKDTLAAHFSYLARSNDQQSRDHYLSYAQNAAVASAAVDNDYVRVTGRDGDSANLTWGGRLDHKGSIDGELFKLDLRMSSSDNENNSLSSNIYALSPYGAPDTRYRQISKTENNMVDFTGDYERPVAQGMIKLGYKALSNKNIFDNGYTNIDPLTQYETVNSLRTNRFQLAETNLALYGSYQFRLNEDWGLLAGLRVENTHIDLQQFTANMQATNQYTNYIPSFFANYKVSDNASLRFSYAHRIRRPNANDLNPFVVYRDEFNVSSGNPKLKPTQTDSFEIAYETKFGAVDTNLRAYYRTDSDAISDRSYFISETVLLTTKENAGSSQSGGLEFSLSGKISPKLSINTSGNLAYQEQNSFGGTSLMSKRSATSLSMRARVNYQATELDQLQISLNAQGKTLSGQGYRQPSATANFSYRRTITPTLNLVMNVTDLFNSNKIETVIDTVTLRETNVRRFDGRIIFIGLSYRLGGFTPPVRGGANGNRTGRPEGQGGPGGQGEPRPGGFAPPPRD